MTSARLVRSQAQRLVAEAITADERVLVIGATGWFGSTALALMADHSAPVMAVASRARTHRVGDRDWAVQAWDEAAVAAFAPTIILNFAFLTRDKEALLGADAYAQALTDLNERLVTVTRTDSVRGMLTVTSGAAIHVPEGEHLPIGAYGEAKRAEEELALSLVDAHRTVVVARAWSLSGALVQRPTDYAFSDLILQARSGEIRVMADCEVWRRYCGVDDYIAVCVAALAAGRSGVIDSGGPEVELRDLAALIAGRIDAGARVEAPSPSQPARRYLSDDRTWQDACRAAGFTPATLEEQIDDVARVLLASA